MTAPIRFAELPQSRWPNGAGRKADVAAGPLGDDGRPDWLLSYAWLEADAPFSDYSGIDRTITLISGIGFALDFGEAAAPLVVQAPFQPRGFDGGWPAKCLLPAGNCLVLNAMSRRGRWRHRVTTASTRVPLPAVQGERLLVVLRGRCSLEGTLLGPRDAVRTTEAVQLAAASDCLLAVAQFEPVAP
jgi:environmental stress-induced protein Ves